MEDKYDHEDEEEQNKNLQDSNLIKGNRLNDINEFDDILEIIGNKGKYQKLLFYGFTCPFYGLLPLIVLSNIYLLYTPEHWCSYNDNYLLNSTALEIWKGENLPIEIGPDGAERYSQCEMYDPIVLVNRSIIKCPNGWQYDQSEFESTIATDYDWVCEKDSYSTYIFTVSTMGSLTGTIIFGILADKIGRKPVYFIATFMLIFFRLVGLYFPQHFIVFNILSFVNSMGFHMSYSVPSMLVAEFSDDEFRSFTYSFSWGVWVFGMASLPYLAYFIGNWFPLGLVTTLPLMLAFLYFPFIPESARWLTSVGKIKEAGNVLRKVAKVNRTENKLTGEEIDEALERVFIIQQRQRQKQIGIWTLFSKRNVAKNTILLTISWTMNNVIYEVVTLNTPNMSGDQFFNFFLLSIVEVPASIVGGYMLMKLGRRWTQVLFFLVCAINCFIAAIVVIIPDTPILIILSTLGAKFAVTITFLIIYLQATELFPTPLRSSGNSFSGTCGAAFGMLGPSMVYLGKYYAGAPYIAMGVMSVTGLLSSAFLPETLHQHLPETVEDANEFGKGQKFWSLRPKNRRKSEVEQHEINEFIARRKSVNVL